MNESQLQNLSDKEFCEYVEPDSDIAREAIKRLSVSAAIETDELSQLERELRDSERRIDEVLSEYDDATDNIEWIKDKLNEVISSNSHDAIKNISDILDEFRVRA